MIGQKPHLTESDRRFLQEFEQDREDAPWMMHSDWHSCAVDALKVPLRWYAADHHIDRYTGSNLWVYYRVPSGAKHRVAPDVFMANVPDHPRESFDIEEEGAAPAFVLEVVSPGNALASPERGSAIDGRRR